MNNKLKKYFYKISILLLVFFIFFATIANILTVYLNSPGSLDSSSTLIIEKGLTREQIVDKLSLNKIVNHPNLFKACLIFYGINNKFKSGEYKFTENISPAQVINILIEGKSIIHKLTIPEGYYSEEIIKKLNEIDLLNGEISQEIPEGYLLPSTYFYSYGDQKNLILEKMLTGMTSLLDKYTPMLPQNSPIKTRYQLLILASIVEAEAILDEEKPRIAAIYLNRLRKNMKLQADPTTIYSITNGKYRLNRRLTYKDLKLPSKINTYHINGLPPKPICCPGEKAIKAVVHAPRTNELYFVSNGSLGHYFSSNLNEHNKNVAKYRSDRAMKKKD